MTERIQRTFTTMIVVIKVYKSVHGLSSVSFITFSNSATMIRQGNIL